MKARDSLSIIFPMKIPLFHVVAATLLVAGTSIGGGMLALPVMTAEAGFGPSLVMMALTWVFMTTTALLLLEANLWMPEGAHIITMASRLLGPWAKALAWLLYLFMAYASLVAYTAACGSLIGQVLPISPWACNLLFILIFGLIIDFGARIVGVVNALLVGGMVLAYFVLIGTGLSAIKPFHLAHADWTKTLRTLPLLLTVFSFQCIVPSLTIYLKKSAKHLKIAIISGMGITFVVYALWQLLVLGTVPLHGTEGLLAAFEKGDAATAFYQRVVQTPWIGLVAAFFAFFAVSTSFLGIGLGLFDFLSDGLKVPKKGRGKFILALLIVVPTLILATTVERIFLLALDTSGGFGDTILNGILPALMVWAGRYEQKRSSPFKVSGGKSALVLVLLFALFILGYELLKTLGHLA